MMEILEKLSLTGIVPVIAIDDAADAVPLCKACLLYTSPSPRD